MSRELDRGGIFKARAASWMVRPAKESQSVAISIEYVILAQLDGKEWHDWSGYEEHRCFGNHYVVKKDGTPNVATVQQLAAAFGWDGSLRRIQSAPPPQDLVVQITVKEDTYEGKTRFRAEWVNPGDYVPTAGGADETEVQQLDARFGSLLRAAAGARPPAAKPAPAKPKPAPAAAAAQPKVYPATGDEIPF